jgi:hypothetical protein
MVARLIQRFFIKVPALARSVPLHQQPFAGRAWPFGNITMRAFVSPDIDDPAASDVQLPYLGLGQQAFWPRAVRVGPVTQDWIDFEFECTATGVKASAPQIFLDNSIVHTPDLLLQVVHHYRNEVEAERRGALATDWTRPNLYRSTLIADGDNKPRRYIARVASGKVRFAPEDKPGNTHAARPALPHGRRHSDA